MHRYHKGHTNAAPGFNVKLRKGNSIGFRFSFSRLDSHAQISLKSNHVKPCEKGLANLEKLNMN